MADWTGTAEAYAASFAALTAGAVAPLLDAVRARVRAEGTLLDVGTGPGTLLADAIARGWAVEATDAEASMVEAARRRFPDVRIEVAALPDLPIAADAFDVVTANFVLNHVPDPWAAAVELGRVSRSLVAASVWVGGPSPLRPVWDAVLDAAGVARPPEKTLDPSLDFDRTQEGFAALLAPALDDVAVVTASWDLVISPAALWLGVEGGVATVGGLYRGADAPTRERLAAAYREVTAGRVDGAGCLIVPHSALIGTGRPRRRGAV